MVFVLLKWKLCLRLWMSRSHKLNIMIKPLRQQWKEIIADFGVLDSKRILGSHTYMDNEAKTTKEA